ncbi:uncharacterized protein TNCV_1407201 [Trichonephila clavipes]|nr:uncharacterized protein TNCV_1407201 [Trichonephila clavipes]
MSTCRKEFHISCMRSKSSSFETAGCGSRVLRRPTKSHTCSIGDISGEEVGQEKVACVGLNRSLEQSLQHVGVHYPTER